MVTDGTASAAVDFMVYRCMYGSVILLQKQFCYYSLLMVFFLISIHYQSKIGFTVKCNFMLALWPR